MNYIFTYLVYLFFGVLPSFLWLSFYLKKDNDPEPKKLLLKIFLLGALITVPTVSVQEFALTQLKTDYFTSSFIFLITSLTLMALIEESAKFFVVKFGILKNIEFNEPVDGMIYMITAALGFAAAENFFTLIFVANKGFVKSLLHLTSTDIIWGNVLQVSLIRFLGATLLHALCGGIIGFSLGLSFFKKDKDKFIVPFVIIATILHAIYNFSIIKIEEGWSSLIPFALLVVLYIFVSFGFKKLEQIEKQKINEKRN